MIHRFRVLWFGLVAVVALAFASGSQADVLHLKKGGRLEGVLGLETATNITIDVGMGQITIPRDSVARIERKESTLSEYRSRLSRIEKGDVRAYAELARFASSSGHRGESRLMWARVISLDPGNVEAHLALGHVLVGGNYVDEAEAYRANGFVYFDGRWMTPAEQSSLLREREQRTGDDRRVEEARRVAREAEDRARRAEAETARARATAANSSGYTPWGYGSTSLGYGSTVFVGSSPWGGYTGGCFGASCYTAPQIWQTPPPPPMPTPLPQAVPPRPSSWR